MKDIILSDGKNVLIIESSDLSTLDSATSRYVRHTFETARCYYHIVLVLVDPVLGKRFLPRYMRDFYLRPIRFKTTGAWVMEKGENGMWLKI